MDNSKLIEDLSEHFSIFFFYAQVDRKYDKEDVKKNHRLRKNAKGIEVYQYKYGDKAIVKQIHYSTLWLIDTLYQKRGKKLLQNKQVVWCLQNELNILFSWKFSNSKNTMTDVLDLLEAVGYIEERKPYEGKRSANLIIMTPLGIHRLNELEDDRKGNVSKLFKLLELEESQHEAFLNRFQEVSKQAWHSMELEAKAARKRTKQKKAKTLRP